MSIKDAKGKNFPAEGVGMGWTSGGKGSKAVVLIKVSGVGA